MLTELRRCTEALTVADLAQSPSTLPGSWSSSSALPWSCHLGCTMLCPKPCSARAMATSPFLLF